MSDRKPPHLLLLVMMSAISPLALNIFMPSMPGIMRIFEAEYSTVQLTLTFYLTAIAVAQLFIGGVSDRFGRRPVVLWGMVGSLIPVLDYMNHDRTAIVELKVSGGKGRGGGVGG